MTREVASVTETAGGIEEKYELIFITGLAGGRWDDLSLVQSYAQFHDVQEQPELYESFTCNTVFKRGATQAVGKNVFSFLGALSLNSDDI